MSAVSNSVMPRSIALWITLREVSRSVRWPKLLQPRPTAETRKPEPPRLRICIGGPVRKNGQTRIVTRDPWARKVRAYHLADVRCFVKLEGMGANIAAPLRANRLAHKKVRPRSDAATDGDRWGA